MLQTIIDVIDYLYYRNHTNFQGTAVVNRKEKIKSNKEEITRTTEIIRFIQGYKDAVIEYEKGLDLSGTNQNLELMELIDKHNAVIELIQTIIGRSYPKADTYFDFLTERSQVRFIHDIDQTIKELTIRQDEYKSLIRSLIPNWYIYRFNIVGAMISVVAWVVISMTQYKLALIEVYSLGVINLLWLVITFIYRDKAQ